MGALSIKIGDVYGRLVVLRRVQNDVRHRPVFECQCVCGTRVKIRSNSLRTGNSRSCGCLKSESSRRNVLMYWRKPKGQAALNALYARYRSEAKQRGLTFELKLEQFAILIILPCHYCAVQPSTRTHYKTYGNVTYNGLDRDNPALGYKPSNVHPCCILCNRMKGHRTSAQFLDWVHRVVKASAQCKARKA